MITKTGHCFIDTVFTFRSEWKRFGSALFTILKNITLKHFGPLGCHQQQTYRRGRGPAPGPSRCPSIAGRVSQGLFCWAAVQRGSRLAQFPVGTDVGSRRWDGEAGPSLFDWDAEAPEHTAVGSSPPPGPRCTEPGQCHSPHAAERCGSQWHSEFLLSPPKIWGSPPAPQGTAPAARWVSSQPPSQATATWQGLSKRWGRRE